jgi:hypothetical protein
MCGLPFVPDLVPDQVIPAIARLYEIDYPKKVSMQLKAGFYLVTDPG